MAVRTTKRSASGNRWRAAFTWRRVLFAALLLAIFGGVALSATWLRICANDACPPIAELDNYDPDQASKVYTADGRLLTTIGMERRTLVTLKEMAPAIPAAFLATEDKRFYRHHGVDWVRLFGAMKSNLLHLDPTRQGFSTITMQLARNIWNDYIDPNQRAGISGIRRKVREAKVALQIEQKYSKEKILELYLNQINLGGAYGVEAAAQRYFGKHAHDVNIAEAAMLAGLAKSPEGYNPRRYPAKAVGRRNLVLELMRDSNLLSAEEVERWKGYPILLSARADYTGVGQYFVDYIRTFLKGRPWGDNLARSGLSIYTTLDLDAQIAAEQALTNQLTRIENGEAKGRFPHATYADYIEKHTASDGERTNTPYLQGAVLMMEAKTGNILAMVGGRDYEDSKFNRITQAGRQPGSTFKPIVYTAAVEKGRTLDDRERDDRFFIQMPDGQPAYSPDNYEMRFSDSLMTMRYGIAHSVNTLAVRFGMDAGIGAVLEEARRFGISAKIDSVPSIMLGAATVKPVEMIAAYTTFANLGKRTIPNGIVRVEDKNGRILWKPQPKAPIDVIDPATAYTMNTALRGVVTNGTGYGPVWAAGFRYPAGGKTGTTSNLWDTWYIGFTSDIVAGVWIGFDSPQTIMPGAQGGVLAAPAWTQMMLEVYRRRPAPADWSQPAVENVQVQIDRSNGLLATPYCPDALREIRTYAKGTEPKEYCKVHSPYHAGGGGNH